MTRIANYLKETLGQDSRKLYLAIVASAFLLRLVYIGLLDNKWYFYDTVHYDKAARSIVAGEGFGKGFTFSEDAEFQTEYGLPPLYPVFLAGVYYFFGDSFFIVRVFQSLVGALTCLMIFLIGRDIFNRKVATIATVISLVYPMFIFVSGLLYVEALFMFLIALTLWFLLRFFSDSKISNLLLAGLSLGLATLARPILFAIYPFLGLWLLIALKRPLGLRIAGAGTLYLVALLTLLPWTVRNYLVFGKITPVSAAFSWYLSNVEQRVGEESSDGPGNNLPLESDAITPSTLQSSERTNAKGNESSGGFIKKISRIVTENPRGFFKHYSKEFVHFWTLYPDRVETNNELTSWLAKLVGILTFGPILLFFILGAYFSVQHWQKASLIFFTILAFSLGYAFFLTRVRYRIPVEPYMLMFAAYGFLEALGKLRSLGEGSRLRKATGANNG